MISEFILFVSDQERSRRFYETVLQMFPVLHVPGMTEFQLSDTYKLGLMPESGIAKILHVKVHGYSPPAVQGNSPPIWVI